MDKNITQGKKTSFIKRIIKRLFKYRAKMLSKNRNEYYFAILLILILLEFLFNSDIMIYLLAGWMVYAIKPKK